MEQTYLRTLVCTKVYKVTETEGANSNRKYEYGTVTAETYVDVNGGLYSRVYK